MVVILVDSSHNAEYSVEARGNVVEGFLLWGAQSDQYLSRRLADHGAPSSDSVASAFDSLFQRLAEVSTQIIP